MDDLISRRQAIDKMQMFIDSLDKEATAYKSLSVAFDRCIIELKRLSSAQPQRMKGRWIHDGYDNPHGVDWMHCSVCGRREPHVPAAMTNFCPSCGADMRGKEKE